jgi:hypothetical protein
MHDRIHAVDDAVARIDPGGSERAFVVVLRGGFDRLVYRVPSRGIEEHGLRAAARILEHGPAPVAMVGWLLRFPYLGGALQRLTSLVVALWRRWTGSASHP